jgi:oxygen-independent coproporphyrinogen III oxidase
MTPAISPSESLVDLLALSPYQGYVYGYPHKLAYQPFNPPVALEPLWSEEDRSGLFLYIHVPFCEMRCSFCNLFTEVNRDLALQERYIAVLERQAHQTKAFLGEAHFARLAVGGGTPTHLEPHLLERLFDVAETMGASSANTPTSVEVSPESATAERLTVLAQRNVHRISIGVQSFIDAEVRAVGRRQSSQQVCEALDRIRKAGCKVLNIDLIYGLPGQTVASLLTSLKTALRFQPEEIYLYPLYVRPLTGLSCSEREWDDIRLACYREARDFLLAAGYSQVSMRMFRAAHSPNIDGPVYCCQSDGMVGLGCGARSYTHKLHYANDYAVGARQVHEILANWMQSTDEDFTYAHFGTALDEDEQRRRFVLLSLLSEEGLNLETYQCRFGSEVLADLPQISALTDLGLATNGNGFLRLNANGIERSDTIGPWLYSPAVRQRMHSYTLR